MIEIIALITLGIIAVGTLSLFAFYIQKVTKLVEEMSKLIKSHDLYEYASKPQAVTEDEVPEFVPAETMEDSLFDKMIKKQLNGEDE